MITKEEAAKIWEQYNGQNVWVRTKHLDNTKHRGRAKVLRLLGSKAEILPEGHKHSEWVFLKDLTWWRAMMSKFHPAKVKARSKHHGKWVIGLINALDEVWWAGKTRFSSSNPGDAYHYNEVRRAKSTLTIVTKTEPAAMLFTLEDAWVTHKELEVNRAKAANRAQTLKPEIKPTLEPEPTPEPVIAIPAISVNAATTLKHAIDQRQYVLDLLKVANEDYERARTEYEAAMREEEQRILGTTISRTVVMVP